MSVSEVYEIPKRKAHVFFLMEKTKDPRIEKRMAELAKEFVLRVSDRDEEEHVEHKIFTIAFGGGNEPMDTSYLPVDKHFDIKCNAIGNILDMTNVFNDLNRYMSRRKLLQSDFTIKPPTVVILADGNKNYLGRKALKKLKGNGWFRFGNKIVITCNTNTEKPCKLFEEFTEDEESVYNCTDVDMEEIVSLIRCVPYRRRCITGHLISHHRRNLSPGRRDDYKDIVTVDDDEWGD